MRIHVYILLLTLLVTSEAWGVNIGIGASSLHPENVATAPKSNAPLLYSSVYYGLEQKVVEQAFHDLLEGAFLQDGPHGLYFMPVLEAMRTEFGLDVNVDGIERQFQDSEKMLYGWRISSATGKSGLPKGAAKVLVNFSVVNPQNSREAIQAGNALNAFASTCTSTEISFNEKVVASVMKSKLARKYNHSSLGWLVNLRDARCIPQKTFNAFAPAFARRAQASLSKLEAGEQIRALYVLLRAGYAPPLSANDVRRIVGYRPDPEAWRASPVSGRPDVMLACAYILAHVLVQSNPMAPRLAMRQEIQNMFDQGITFDLEAMSQAIQAKQLRETSQVKMGKR